MSYTTWRVNPGPRFDEAVSLLLDGKSLARGSLAYKKAWEILRPNQKAPSGPEKMRAGSLGK